MRVQACIGLYILLVLASVSCSGTTNATEETRVNPSFQELNVKRIHVSNIIATYKYTDHSGRENIEEGDTAFGIYFVTADKDGDMFIGEKYETDGFANIESSVIISLDNMVQPRRITHLQIIEYIEIENQYTYLTMAEMENIEIYANEFNDMTIKFVRNGQAVCSYIRGFIEDVDFVNGTTGEVLDFKCDADTSLEIEIVGSGSS